MEKPKTLQAATKYFADDQVCIDTVARLRWSDGKPTCPACGHKDHYWLDKQRRWKCKECWKQFSVKVGTIFEDSPLSLDKWLIALWMLVNCRNGVSSYEIGRSLGVSQKSGWFMLHRLRYALQTGSITKLGAGGAPVEVDETFIGGKARFMHRAKRERLNVQANNKAKTVVIGMLERNGKVRATVAENRKKQACEAAVRENVAKGANIITDEHPAYLGLRDTYTHQVINHLEGYVKENIHTNGIENFWSCLKRGLNGTYIAVEPFHLFRYVDEQAFRFNNRKDESGRVLSDGERFDAALSQIGGKRLTFAEVTGKAAGSPEAF
jgi:transposase-like protein